MDTKMQGTLKRIRALEKLGWQYDWSHDDFFGRGEGWRHDGIGQIGLKITQAIIEYCRLGSPWRHPLLVAVITTCEDKVYRLEFPLCQLASAIAICGWEIVGAIAKTDKVRHELARLEAKTFLEIPADPARWLAAYGTRTA